MQKWFSIIPVIIVLFLPTSTIQGKEVENILKKADSLYQEKKFTEAQVLYLQLYQQGLSSPATLLKMAFVHEGLGQTAHALFFLTSYFNRTEDTKAYDKIQALANARNLTGYELTDFDRVMIWLNNRTGTFIPIIASACVLCLALTFYLQRKKSVNGKLAVGFISIIFLSLLFYSINFISTPARAVVSRSTYFMTGPSAGANFIALVSEGNRVSLSGEQDVWIKVTWNGKDGFLKKSDLLFY